MTDFGIGDIVCLSGSHKQMTVVSISMAQGGQHVQSAVTVAWLAEDGTMQVSTLEKRAFLLIKRRPSAVDIV